MNSIFGRFGRMIAFSLVLMMTVLTIPVMEANAANYYIYDSGVKKVYTGIKWKVNYNGKSINISSTPGLTLGNTGMFPYKEVLCDNGPKMKGSLEKSTGTLTLTYGNKILKVKDGSKEAYLNGKKTALTQTPRYVKYCSNGKTVFMIPIKSVSMIFGIPYSYNNSTATIMLGAKASTASTTVTGNTQAKSFKSMSTAQFINKLGPIAQADAKRSGVMASVTLAQAILESGWGRSQLAQAANNIFGMKHNLSGNTWAGSTWDGKSTYTIRTAEYSGRGKYYIYAAFRKYPCVEKSIADHSAYLTHAKNGSSLRYKGLTATKSYSKQLQIIKNGGYATSGSYVSELTRVIKMYNLTKWDK